MKTQIFSRSEFYDLVWSQSFLTISKKFKIAYDGIRSACRELDIPFPNSGYWAMKDEKKLLYKESLPEIHSGKDEVILYLRNENENSPENDHTTSKSIFQEISEDKRLNFDVPERLSDPDPMVIAAKNSLTSRKNEYHKCDGMFKTGKNELNIITTQNNLARALRFMDTLIKLLKIRGHTLLNENEQTFAVINGENVEIVLREKMKRVVVDEKRGYTSYHPTGLFSIELKALFFERQYDDGIELIESKLPRILASIESGAKHAKQEQARIDEWHRNYQEGLRKEKEYQERLEKEVADFKNLYLQAKRWQRARFMREYISALRENAIANNYLTDDLLNWLQWATEKVNWYDPMINKKDRLLDHYEKDEIM